ncbi:Ig-like domain repeat protein [Aeromicrobium sp. P5_D10]
MSINIRARRGLATAIAAVLATGGVTALASAPAQADPVSVTTVGEAPITNANLTWSLNDEQGGGAFNGSCNFLSAGKAGNTGSSRAWTEGDNFYKTVDGNVTVEKPDTSDVYSQPTWATKCQTPAGANVSAGSVTSLSKNRVRLAAGSGSFDPATGAGTINWTGSFTSAFYGGLTYWSATNPRLVVDATGNGTLTATLSGYGANPDDTSVWTTIPNTPVTLATLTNVDLDADGFTVTPEYLGKTVTVSAGTPQNTTGAKWGSFPQSFVDFQILTGQSSYWYSSGGSRDAAKPASPITVDGYSVGARPEVTVDTAEANLDGTTTITVSGQNFNPDLAKGTRPPLAGQNAGSYVVFGKFAPVWRPSALAASDTRKTATAANNGLKWAVPAASIATVGGAPAGAVELTPEGTFSTSLKIDKAALDATVTNPALTNYGIYTYPGSGAVMGAYETYTPIAFAKHTASVEVTEAPESSVHGTSNTAKVTVDGAAGAPDPTGTVTAKIGATTLASAAVGTDGLATITLPGTIAAGSSSITYAYSGDDNYKAAETSKGLTVSKAASNVAVTSVASSTKYGVGATARLKVTGVAGGTAATGTVTAKIGGTTIGSGAVGAAGAATLTLSKSLKPGTSTVVYTYSGNGNYAGATASKTLTIAKDGVSISDKVTKKPTTKKSGKITVTVKAKSSKIKPTGKVTVYFKKSGQKTVKTSVGTLKNGVGSLSVKKLKKKGTWKIYVKYSAGTGYNSVSSKYVGTVKVTK